ncbi:MAG: DUF123 domain-containing protein, partial [Desulfurococcaceae archaeon]
MCFNISRISKDSDFEKCMKESDERGCYLLIIIVSKDIIVYTRSMSFSLKVGLYIYVGSAFIKGGLYSRVRRHFKKFKK